MGESKTSPRRLKAADRHRLALKDRKYGATYAQIAQRRGYASASGAYKAVMTGLRETLEEPADAVRQLELARLDTLMMASWPAALQGNWLAFDRVLRVMERRARYLGLDAPARLAVDVTLLNRVAEALEAVGVSPADAFNDLLAVLAEQHGGAPDGR